MGIDLGRFKRNKNDEWIDWLTDDPVPPALRSRMRAKAVKEAARPIVRRPGAVPVTTVQPPSADSKSSAVSINISIPRFKFPKPQAVIPPQLIAHKKWAIGIVAVVLVIGTGTSAVLIRNSKQKTGADGAAVLSQNTEKPPFDYSLPKGNAAQLGGDVRFDPNRKVVSFKDSIGGVEITVSQQPLPEGFKDNLDDKVKKLAEDFSAKEVLSTANPTAYLGTAVEGPQTVIFAKKDLLVFILSTKKIDNHDWAEYITNLK